MLRWCCALLVALLSSASLGTSTAPVPLYRITLVQAAPGRLLELINAYKLQFAAVVKAGEEAPMWMRHSQGDHWDLLIIYPMRSDSLLPRRTPENFEAMDIPQELVSWQEDLFCVGMDFQHRSAEEKIDSLRTAFASGSFFHVEMFVALPGSLANLRDERQMENRYSRELKQPENFIFLRVAGAAWDIVTIGVFRDLKHYAASSDATPEAQQAAARAAGFESPAQIGPYLRRFIRTHHDTLAVAIK